MDKIDIGDIIFITTKHHLRMNEGDFAIVIDVLTPQQMKDKNLYDPGLYPLGAGNRAVYYLTTQGVQYCENEGYILNLVKIGLVTLCK